MAKATRQAEGIVSLKVTLRGIRPPVWRRLWVPGRMTLGDLHHVIQAAMGWDNAHLHAFNIAGREYSDPHEVDDAADEERLTVNGCCVRVCPASPIPTTSATTGSMRS